MRVELIKKQRQVAITDPRLLIDVHPSDIIQKSDSGCNFLRHAGTVASGNWDKDGRGNIRQTARYRSFRRRFNEGIDWEDTEFYEYKCERIKNNADDKYRSREYLNQKCDEIDQLYEDIKEYGYKKQEELRKNNDLKEFGAIASWIFPDYCVRKNEVAIDIGRDGTIYWNEGRHRITVALILELEQIPVRVVARHRKWQDLRNRILDRLENVDEKMDRQERLQLIENFIENEIDRDVKYGARHPDIEPLVTTTSDDGNCSG